jgi:chemotaxis protein CheX
MIATSASANQPEQAADRIIGQTLRMDCAVAEVVEGMLRLSCAVVSSQPLPGRQISAKILFSGPLDGDCTIQMSVEAAVRLTGALLASQGPWDDEMLDDAVGELCNMIAGRWKSSLGAAAKCQLSVPMLSRSGHRTVPGDGSAISLQRFYAFGDSAFQLILSLRQALAAEAMFTRPEST